MTLSAKFRYGMRMLRFKDWSVQTGVFLLGAFFQDNLLARGWFWVVISLLLSSCCLAYGYALNEFFDELEEELTQEPGLENQLLYFIAVLAGVGMGVAWFISPLTFGVMLLIIVTVWLHSAPPFRLKRRLFWRLFLNSLGFGLFFLIAASLDRHLSAGEMLMGLYIFGLYLPLELIHVLAHMEADRAKGLSTLALAHGEKKTIALAMTVLTALILYSGLLWQLGLVTLATAGWSGLHFALLQWVLWLFSRRQNSVETYARLRFRTKIVCAFYGAGLLAIFIGKI